jgi:hypothetical protein
MIPSEGKEITLEKGQFIIIIYATMTPVSASASAG